MSIFFLKGESSNLYFKYTKPIFAILCQILYTLSYNTSRKSQIKHQYFILQNKCIKKANMPLHIFSTNKRRRKQWTFKKILRWSNWSELKLFTEFCTGIYKIPCQIIYIPSYFDVAKNEMFLFIIDRRQIFSVIQLFWNKPCPARRLVIMPLRLCKKAVFKHLPSSSSVFKDENVFNLPYFSHQFSKFSHYYFLSPWTLHGFESLGRQRRPLPPPQLGKLLPKGWKGWRITNKCSRRSTKYSSIP